MSDVDQLESACSLSLCQCNWALVQNYYFGQTRKIPPGFLQDEGYFFTTNWMLPVCFMIRTWIKEK